MKTAPQKEFSVFIRFVFILIGIFAFSCSQEDGRWIPSNDNLSPEEKKEVKAAFWNKLKKMERKAGKKSSFSVYKKMCNLAKLTEKVKINDYDNWILGESWEDDAPQAAFLLENIKQNEKALKKLSEGARLNHPLFPPTPFNKYLVPLYLDHRALVLLHLANAKYRATEKFSLPEGISPPLYEETNLVLDVLYLGGHFMCNNAFLIHYIQGNGMRLDAVAMLQWFIENDRYMAFDRKTVIQKILDHESQRNTMDEGVYYELSKLRDYVVDDIRKNLPSNPSKNVIDNLRQRLAKHRNQNIDHLSDKDVLDFYSLDKLNQYFDEYLSLLMEYNSLSPEERENLDEEYKKRFGALSPNRSPWLSGLPIPDFIDTVRRETIVTARLRLIVTSLALQEAGKEGKGTTTEEALQSLGIPQIWSINPFTGKSFSLERPSAHKARLSGEKPTWFKEMRIDATFLKNFDLKT